MKKLLIAGAAGAMIFGLTAASASTLNLSEGGWYSHTVQQSDIATVTCAAKQIEVGMQVTGDKVKSVKLLSSSSDLAACNGSMVQVVAFKGNATKPYAVSSKARIDTALNYGVTELTFSPALKAQEVTHVRVTIADEIIEP